MNKYFDAHTHTQFAAFENDWRKVIDRTLKNNVWLVNVGTQKDTSARAVEIANFYSEGVYAAVGLHPIHTEKSYHDSQELGEAPAVSFSNSRELENKGRTMESQAKGFTPLEARTKGAADANGVLPLTGFTSRGEEFDYEYYKKLALAPKVVAIGECGLDYYRVRGQESGVKQKEAFLAQIELAAEVKKPLMIHCRSGSPERTSSQNEAGRNAFDDLIEILKSEIRHLKSDASGVIHFFSGTVEDAKKLLDLRFSFTFGGVITFARDYDDVIKAIPLDRILSETDAPYVAPAPYRGKRNEPTYVAEVVKKLAEIKNISVEAMTNQVFENARNVFRLP